MTQLNIKSTTDYINENAAKIAAQGNLLGYTFVKKNKSSFFIDNKGKKLSVRGKTIYILNDSININGFIFKKGTEVKIHKDKAILRTINGSNVGVSINEIFKNVIMKNVVVVGNKFLLAI